jgi:hypothetical protein
LSISKKNAKQAMLIATDLVVGSGAPAKKKIRPNTPPTRAPIIAAFTASRRMTPRATSTD